MSVPVSLPLPVLVIVWLLIKVILLVLKWYFIMVLIYFSLMAHSVDHLFIFFGQMSDQIVCPFTIGLFVC